MLCLMDLHVSCNINHLSGRTERTYGGWNEADGGVAELGSIQRILDHCQLGQGVPAVYGVEQAQRAKERVLVEGHQQGAIRQPCHVRLYTYLLLNKRLVTVQKVTVMWLLLQRPLSQRSFPARVRGACLRVGRWETPRDAGVQL